MYHPSEDSYFLSSCLKKFLHSFSKDKLSNINVLDMGSGTGIQAQTCISLGVSSEKILCADIDLESLKYLQELGLKTVRSDLFTNISNDLKFDLIIFNPPYLPESKFDNHYDITGGKRGDETILRFLAQSLPHLNPNGKILLLLSSLTPMKKIRKTLTTIKLQIKKFDELKMAFEKLFVFVIYQQYN